VADNQWEWPAQYPRYTPDTSQPPSAGYPAPPPAGYPAGYQVPAPPPGYQVPPRPQVPPAGYQVAMNPAMRAATADRERTVDVLKAGFAEGRLTQDEYNDRMGRAYAARTYGELFALTADLPAGALPAWPVPVYSPPPPAATSGTNSMAIASMVLGVAEFFTAGLTAIPAVICGHIARRELRLSGQRGDGLATGGLVLGYMAIIFWSVLIAATLVALVMRSNGPIYAPVPSGPLGP
jgi:Domain of unknown function (DUF1707)/Domain of unknown function (DUF4190)